MKKGEVPTAEIERARRCLRKFETDPRAHTYEE